VPGTNDPQKIEQLQDLVNRLDVVLEKTNRDGRRIEEKSWDILRFTTTEVGIGLSVLALFRGEINRTFTTWGMVVTIVILAILYGFVLWIAWIDDYGNVPGTPQNDERLGQGPKNGMTPQAFIWRYDVSSREYYRNLIEDYVGHQKGIEYPEDEAETAIGGRLEAETSDETADENQSTADVSYENGAIEDALVANVRRSTLLTVTYGLSMVAMIAAIGTVIVSLLFGTPAAQAIPAVMQTAVPTATATASPTETPMLTLTATP